MSERGEDEGGAGGPMTRLTMRSRTVEVPNALGMHARPSAGFVKLASRFISSIMVSCNDLQNDMHDGGPVGDGVAAHGPPTGGAADGAVRTGSSVRGSSVQGSSMQGSSVNGLSVNGKSIMGVLMLAAARGSRLTITATGEDAEEAVAALADLVRRGFDE